MRCHICDTILINIHVEAGGKIDPCGTCQEAIDDCVEGYEESSVTKDEDFIHYHDFPFHEGEI